MAPPSSSTALRPFVCLACSRQRLAHHVRRPFASSSSRRADDASPANNNAKKQDDSIIKSLSNQLQQSRSRGNAPNRTATSSNPRAPFSSVLDKDIQSLYTEEASFNLNASTEKTLPHRLHVYAHKHNTHITLVQPPKSAAETMRARLSGAKVTAAEQKKQVDTLISMSTGNLGFRKSNRSSYDAAFQLAAFVLKQMEERGLMGGIKNIDVVLRGFGAGREAVTKAIMGSEGRNLRPKMSAVVDATRLKQGGPRSKKPRRLG